MAGEQPSKASQFNARSDRAALALRQNLLKRGAEIPESRAVEVTENGRPPAPMPPEGSYARQAIEMQRRQGQQRQSPQELTEDDDIDMAPQDPQATLRSDPAAGSSPSAAASSGEVQQLSPNAQRRISQLTEDLRRKDQELQQLAEDAKHSKSSLGELEQKMAALQEQHKQLLEQSLAGMDPDTRAQVLLDGRLAEAIAQSERRLMDQVLPHLARLDRQSADAEMRRLAARYPGFAIDVHGPLIEAFRRQNPRCTVEQAFRAVAEPEELQLATQVRASAVPPIAPPGNGRVQSRWQPEQKSNPEDELVEESRQLRKLMESTDPDDKSMRNRFVQQHLAKRLDRILPK